MIQPFFATKSDTRVLVRAFSLGLCCGYDVDRVSKSIAPNNVQTKPQRIPLAAFVVLSRSV
jgi:hypothetical protein